VVVIAPAADKQSQVQYAYMTDMSDGNTALLLAGTQQQYSEYNRSV
jgi:hypothetical protein